MELLNLEEKADSPNECMATLKSSCQRVGCIYLGSYSRMSHLRIGVPVYLYAQICKDIILLLTFT